MAYSKLSVIVCLDQTWEIQGLQHPHTVKHTKESCALKKRRCLEDMRLKHPWHEENSSIPYYKCVGKFSFISHGLVNVWEYRMPGKAKPIHTNGQRNTAPVNYFTLLMKSNSIHWTNKNQAKKYHHCRDNPSSCKVKKNQAKCISKRFLFDCLKLNDLFLFWSIFPNFSYSSRLSMNGIGVGTFKSKLFWPKAKRNLN